MTTIDERLEYLRGELRAECISYGELAELADLAAHIDPSDVELLEAAGVPEFPEQYGPQPGDYCSLGRSPAPAHHVTHYKCDDYADGAVVDATTGKIVTHAKINAPRGFHR